MTSTRARCAARLLAGLLGLWCAGVAGQTRDPLGTEPDARLERWLAAVARHEAGSFDAAAREIASWPDHHLATVVDDVRELTRFVERARVRFRRSGVASTAKTSDGRRWTASAVQQLLGLTDEEADTGDGGRLVMRAVLLHTDITQHVDEYDPIEALPSRPARRAFLVADGREAGVSDTGPHWELARALLDLVPPDSPGAEAKRRWYVATAAFMQSRGHQAALLAHLNHALRVFPTDAELRFYDGCMHETLASPSIQRAIRSMPAPVQATVAVRDPRTHLDRARAQFRDAIESNPGLVEARVRLGYVLGALDRPEEAAAELRAALAAPAEPQTHYYAALFLGSVQARLGNARAARASYERAAALFPRAQSPRLALSSLARAAGDRSAATTILLQRLPATDSPTLLDPWWEYFYAPLDRADRLLRDWRRSVVNGTTP